MTDNDRRGHRGGPVCFGLSTRTGQKAERSLEESGKQEPKGKGKKEKEKDKDG